MHRILLFIILLASTCALANATSSVGDSGVTTTGYLQSDSISTTKINNIPVSSFGASSPPPAFRVNKNGTNQSITSGTNTLMTWSTVEFDTNSAFNTSTGRYTPTVAGYYQVNLVIACTNMAAGNACVASIAKNGTTSSSQVIRAANGSNVSSVISTPVYMNGTTDYLTAIGYSEASTAVIVGTAIYTNFNGYMIGAAPVQ